MRVKCVDGPLKGNWYTCSDRKRLTIQSEETLETAEYEIVVKIVPENYYEARVAA